MDYLRIHLGDEAPDLGSGHRSVLVLSVGPSWAHLLDPSDCQHVKLPRAGAGRSHGYDDLARRGVALPLEPERLVARLLKNAAAMGRWNGIVRDACLALGADASRLPAVEGAGGGAEPPMSGGTGVDEPTVALPGEKIGAFVRRLYLCGRHAPDAIVELARAAFPGSAVNRGHVSWYYNDMRKRGVVDLPPWPKKG
jgi:hypothetical protein